MKKVIMTFFIVLTLAGCQTAANFQKAMDSWMGGNINDMVDQYGYPDGELTAPSGNKVYVYSSSGTYVTPTQTTYNTYGNYGGGYYNSTTNALTTGGIPISLACTVYVEFNDENIIQNINWKGNNCVM